MTDKHPCHTPQHDDEPPEMVTLKDIVSDDDEPVDPGGVNFRYSRRDDRDDESDEGNHWRCNVCGKKDFESREDFADHWEENHE